MRRRLLAIALLVLLSLAGCGGGDGDGAGDTTADTDGGAQTIEVSASDFAFGPADLQADPGELTIVLTNDGESPHAIEIEGNGVETSSNTINGGETTELTLDLDAGTYEIYCPVGDHRDMGMVGTLTVGSGGGSGGGTGTGDDDGGTETGGSGSDTGDGDYRY